MREMTDEEITAKHKRIRGTHELKYPPNESRCRQTCGTSHDPVLTGHGERLDQHKCFLVVGHPDYCQFSSACTEEMVLNESQAAA